MRNLGTEGARLMEARALAINLAYDLSEFSVALGLVALGSADAAATAVVRGGLDADGGLLVARAAGLQDWALLLANAGSRAGLRS